MKKLLRWILVFTICVRSMTSKYANISGDIMLGGLFPIHAAIGDGKCGNIQEQDGIQMLEAMAFSIQKINMKGFLPGFTLGMIGMDTCESDTIALENTLEFVKSKVNAIPVTIQHTDFICQDGSIPYNVNNTTNVLRKLDQVVGVVGPALSKVSIQVASFLRLFKLPQISYYSTSPELSNRDRFSYFKRTVPSDFFQARAVVEILRKFGWEYVSGLYEDSSYGINLFSEVERLSTEVGICFGFVEKIPFSKEDEEEMDNVVSKILEKQNKNGKVVVVLFVRFTLAKKIFRAAQRQEAGKKVIWVGSDAWSGRQFEDEDIRNIIQGSITVQPLARRLDGFDEYFTGLDVNNNNWNPWFREFWQSHFDCKFSTKDEKQEEEKHSCGQYENISKENGYKQLLALYFVSDAVYAFANALKQMHKDACGSVNRICRNMTRIIDSGKHMLNYLDKVQFKDALGYNFTFINGTDGPPRYSIMTYINIEGEYDWKEIGTYTGVGDQYELFMDTKPTAEEYELSACSSHCKHGQYRSVTTENKCCWTCRDCRSNQYLSSVYICEDCPIGFLPNNFRNACYPAPIEQLTFINPWSIAASAVSSVGILMCLFVIVVFVLKRETPVIKASGMELSLVLLAGILLSYVSTFVFLAPPSAFICGATRVLLGTCYTLCYAAVATKTNRIYRIFDGSSPQKKKFTGWQSSLVITFLITVVEIIAIVTWLISNKPRSIIVHPSMSESVLLCDDATDYSYLVVLVYPFLVMIACIYFAIKTRKTPDGFNETNQIAFCSYSTCILWLAFIPVYFVTNNNTIRVMALCFSMSVSASVCLVSLFLTKVYTVVFSPKKNTKDTVMTRSSHSRNSNATELGGKSASRTASTFTINLNGSTPRLSVQQPFSPMSTMSTLSITDIDIGLSNLRAERQLSTDSGPFKPGLTSETSSLHSLSRSMPNLLDYDYKSLTRQQHGGSHLQCVPESITELHTNTCD